MSEIHEQPPQPPLPFEPPLRLAPPPAPRDDEREVSADRFTALLFEELARRISDAQQ